MFKNRDEHNRLLDRLKIAKDVIEISQGGIRMDLIEIIVGSIFPDKVFTEALGCLIKQVVLGAGQINDNAIAIVFCKSSNTRE